jgi:SHS2 domain-containing protein
MKNRTEPEPCYRIIEHTADLRLEIYGKDLQALFINAAHALFAVLVPLDEGEQVPARRRQTIDLEGGDWADLMVNWLRELLYIWNGETQLLSRLELHHLSERRLKATLFTGDFDPRRHHPDKEVKAVTYHQIEVAPDTKGWRARVLFDV